VLYDGAGAGGVGAGALYDDTGGALYDAAGALYDAAAAAGGRFIVLPSAKSGGVPGSPFLTRQRSSAADSSS
jgi:hypothetical protein